MTTVLITGASGFIGGHLAEILAQRGVQVRCLVRRPETCTVLKEAGVQLIQGDVTQPASLYDAVQGTDVVYHLAGLTSAFRADDLKHVNQGGTTNVARACAAQRNPPVHILVSSIAAAGPIGRDKVRAEADPAAPVSNYGRSKRLGELAVEEFAHIVPTTVVRPGIVFGERNREMLAMFKGIDRFRVHAIPSIRTPRLTLIYVKDCAELIIRAAERGTRIPAEKGEARATGQGYYFAGANEFPTYTELGHMIARSMGYSRARLLPLMGPLAWIAAGANELSCRVRGVSDSFNIDKIREARCPSWACSPAAAERDLDFRPRLSLQQQLEITTQWYRENHWIGERPILDALRKIGGFFKPSPATSKTYEQRHRVES